MKVVSSHITTGATSNALNYDGAVADRFRPTTALIPIPASAAGNSYMTDLYLVTRDTMSVNVTVSILDAQQQVLASRTPPKVKLYRSKQVTITGTFFNGFPADSSSVSLPEDTSFHDGGTVHY